jgi:hypothetical protein
MYEPAFTLTDWQAQVVGLFVIVGMTVYGIRYGISLFWKSF